MSTRYEVVPGSGLLARRGDAVVWATPDVDQAAWDILLRLLDQAPGTEASGADTADRIGGLLGELEEFPNAGFVALLCSNGECQGVLRGAVTVRNENDAAPATAYGSVGITVPFALAETIFVGYVGSSAAPAHTLFQLTDGVVPGDGTWVHPAPAAPDEPAPAVVTTGGVPGFVSNAPSSETGQNPVHVPEPAPAGLRIDLRAAQFPTPPTPLPPLIPSAPEAPVEPQRGVLVFDDGSTFALDHDYVIGRKPERHELVTSGQARPLTVVDPDTVLSGAHAAIRLQGADVYLEDLGSLNGTHLAFTGAAEWTRLQPHQPVALEPGTRLLFGWTVATYSGSGGSDQP